MIVSGNSFDVIIESAEEILRQKYESIFESPSFRCFILGKKIQIGDLHRERRKPCGINCRTEDVIYSS